MQTNKNARLVAFAEAVQATYPELFNLAKPKPLSIGMHTQLRASIPDASMTLVRNYLREWTRRTEYLQAITEGDVRYNLSGESDQPISAEHKKLAEEMLAKRIKPKRPRRPTNGKKRPSTSLRANTRPGAGAAAGTSNKSGDRPPVIIKVKKRRVIAPTH